MACASVPPPPPRAIPATAQEQLSNEEAHRGSVAAVGGGYALHRTR
ncbi:unnamed protein product [Ectocarpus sp. 12 AP-2014]